MTTAHAGFILAAYLICFGVIATMIGAIWLDHRRLTQDLARLGGTRRENGATEMDS
jgi:heme exporter protein CcmD